MSDESLIVDLVARAETLRQQGTEPDLAALCAAAPHLLAEVRDRLARLAVVDAVLTPPRPQPAPSVHELAARHGYQVVRPVGGGNMGLVYEARDPHGRTVALKTINQADPNRLAALKREYAALADVRHENLAAVYGQVSDGVTWFSVMEFVPGRHFLAHVRGGPAGPADETLPLQAPAACGPFLRPALLQLARGIHFLHRLGRPVLHRDIKSSNVLVTPDGRVKLIDYGLAADLDASQQYPPHGLVGTVGYMSPEACAGRPLTPASDWYSFGALLYEALTGRLPFQGDILDLLNRKQTEEPPPPAAVTPDAGVPDDLNALCAELLRIDSAARPTGEEVLRRLGAEPAPPPPPADEVLVGRDGHLATLRAALADVRRGGAPIIVELHGPSGAGKSALARRFLREAQAAGAVVLAGPCYEQSAVPYKALDSLIDTLCRYLRKLPRERADALLPVHVGELARLFPVFGRLEAVAEAAPARADDPHQVRRRAQAALRDLLHRMAGSAPLVLFIDDLQWGDAESAALLGAVVLPPDAPPVLVLAGYRRGDGAASPFVRAVRQMAVERRELLVDPLTHAEARALAGALLGDGYAEQAGTIARESDGSPLLVHELVQFFRTGAAADALTLDTVLRARAARLADDPRRLLEAVAVAAGPIDPDTAGRAAGLEPSQLPGALDDLLTGKFVRSVTAGEGRRVEAYHDRVRQAVAGGLAGEVRARYHRRLAVAHKAAGDAGPEVLAYHFSQAGDAAQAAPYHVAAAGQAADALAFDRAADHYRQSLDGLPPDDPRRRDWLLALGGALASAGRGREAADAFTRAAGLSAGTDALFARQRAAEQLVRSGRLDEGMAALHAVLAAVGVRMPATPGGLVRSILWLRIRVRLRGLRPRARAAAPVPTAVRLRLEVFRWASAVVGMMYPLPGAWLHLRGLLLSLRAGDPVALAQALGREATMGRPVFGQSAARVERLTGRAYVVAAGIPDPTERAASEAVIEMSRAIAYFLMGDLRHALDLTVTTAAALARCGGVSTAYQRSVIRLYEVSARLYLGDLSAARAVFEVERQAQVERGNVRGAIMLPLVTRAHQFALAADDPAGAGRLVREARDRWGRIGMDLLHAHAWAAEIDIGLYEGRAAAAWAHCDESWPEVSRRSLVMIRFVRLLVDAARGRAAVALAAAGGPGADALRREAGRRARRLERLRQVAIAPPHGWLIRAAVAHQTGRPAEALRHLERAEVAFDEAGMTLYVAAARRRRGELMGEAGRELVAAADAAMVARGVVNPARFAAVYAPGFGPAPDSRP